MTTTQPDAEKLFSTWLAQHQHGTLDLELGDAVTQLTDAVLRLDKKGTLQLTITVEPQKGVGVAVAAKTTLKAPENDPVASFYFVDAQGRLTRRDPQQPLVPARDGTEPIFPTTEAETNA